MRPRDRATVEGRTYPFNPATQTTEVLTIEGVTFSKIGASIVVIGGMTFTIGPGAQAIMDVYNGYTISLGPGGVGFASTTLPFVLATQVITAGGVTFSKIGSTIVVIGGTTFTIGPGAKTTIDEYNGQTSLGSGRIGFASTTLA